MTTRLPIRRWLTPPDAPQRAVGRFASLEGYRGLAALLVVVFHVYQFDRVGYPLAVYPYAGTVADVLLRNLDSMVDMFLVLSAFLLGLPFARAVLGEAWTRPGAGSCCAGRCASCRCTGSRSSPSGRPATRGCPVTGGISSST